MPCSSELKSRTFTPHKNENYRYAARVVLRELKYGSEFLAKPLEVKIEEYGG
ncbi:MAG: hypothetical protein KBG43_08615 [Paludibacteraceae bacterium]|nr:hypothetical protein [Paludibacteraceae bacterium]